STFLGVFIRVLVIFLVIFLIGKLPDITTNIWDRAVQGPSWGTRFFARMFLILGLLLFAKQATKLISEVFGISDGSLKLGIKDKLSDLKQPVFRAGAAIGGAATAGARNFRGSKGQGAGRITSTLGGIAGGAKKGLKYGKGADSASAMKDAAGKAGKEVNQKAVDRYDAGGLFGKMLKDMGEFPAKVDKWSGGGVTFEEQSKVKRLEKEDAILKEQESKSKAAREAAKSIFELNATKAKIEFSDKEIEKLARAMAYSGPDGDYEAMKTYISSLLGGTPYDTWKDFTYGILDTLRSTGKTPDGKNTLDARAINGLVGYLGAYKDNAVSDMISGKQGTDKEGNWVNTNRGEDTGREAQIAYSPKLEAAIQDVVTTLQKGFKELGADNQIFSKEAIRFFADGTKDYHSMLRGQTAKIEGAQKTLGEILNDQRKASGKMASQKERELSELYIKIEEAKKSEEKK
ncbi:MAG TPA: hypothetical protein PK737_01470, partial [Bacilli bacterium]|nr:hypothetical protein [Bacilli bacterium]